MAFNKTTARKAGKKSKRGEAKTTRQARELFIEIMGGEIEHIQTTLATVREKNPEKYLDILSKLLKYYLPEKIETETRAITNELPKITLFTKGIDDHKAG